MPEPLHFAGFIESTESGIAAESQTANVAGQKIVTDRVAEAHPAIAWGKRDQMFSILGRWPGPSCAISGSCGRRAASADL